MSNLFVISGPSGSGKSTLCKEVLNLDNNIKISVSATTRTPREGEIDGVSYFFISHKDFENKIANNEFYEYAKVYKNYYGTPKSAVDAFIKQGYDVILEIDVQGGMQIKQINPNAILIFIMPPSIEILKQRLRGRDTESEEQYNIRVDNALKEIAMKKHYNHEIVNDVLEDASKELLSLIQSYRE